MSNSGASPLTGGVDDWLSRGPLAGQHRYGATGGPDFATTVVVTGAGHEQRIVEARGRWTWRAGSRTRRSWMS
jgi:hypothetical protein